MVSKGFFSVPVAAMRVVTKNGTLEINGGWIMLHFEKFGYITNVR